MTYFDEDDGRPARGAQVQRLVTFSGALVSLALICGMGYWGYKLLVRDVNGVPVVQAMEGAFRIAPEDPGGAEAPYQGLAVNEVAAGGTVGGETDRITFAPPPVELAEEDAPRDVLAERATAEAPGAIKAVQDETESIAAAGQERPSDIDGDNDAASERADLGDDPDGAAIVAVEDRPDGALATDLAVAEALAGLMEEEDGAAPVVDGISLRPSPRPAALRTAAEALAADRPVTVSAELPRPAEIDVAALSIGTRLVQLGAFADADMARQEWARISERFAGRFADKRRVVQPATSGGQTFYRLRAEGFEDLAEARQFCSALLADEADCIPVELR